MKFLFLSQYFPPEIGAPSVRLGALAKELKRKGHEVEVITALPNYPTGSIFPEYSGRLYVKEIWESIPVHRVWLYPALGGGFRRMLNYGSFTLTATFLLWKVKRPDFIFVESPPLFLGFTGWMGHRLWGAPIIFNVADLWPDAARSLGAIADGPLLRMAYRFESWVYRKAAFVNAVTDGIREVILRVKGVPEEKVLFLPNGVDTSIFKPLLPDESLRRALGLEGKRIILYAGNHGFAHGLDVALRAASLLRERAPEVQFLFVGDGSEKKRLMDMAKKMECGNVQFLPPVPPEKLVELYALASIALVTLRRDPLNEGVRPSKLFPAMATATPVIYSGSGEGAKLVETARAGIVVPPEDPQALSEAVLHLLNNSNLAQDMGLRGRRFVEENFSWSAIVDRWLEDLHRKVSR